MNIIEKQTELGKSLFEINTSTMKEYMSLQRGNFERYVEVNREFGSKLPEVKNLTNVVELQREYSQTLWNHTKASFEAQSELLKGAFTNTREALKVAYTFDGNIAEEVATEKAVEAAPKPKAKAKAKPKAKAKKTAEA